MNIRPWVKEKDYALLHSWWAAWKFPNPPVDLLPDVGGFIVEHLGQPLAAGFFIQLKENVPLGWVEWVVVNPEADRGLRYAGLQLLFDDFAARAKQAGLAFLITFSDSARFVELLTNGLGFISTGQYTGCIRPLILSQPSVVSGESDQVVEQEGQPVSESPILRQGNGPTSG